MGVSINGGALKSFIFKRVSLINHPLWGTPFDGHVHKVIPNLRAKINPQEGF